MPPGYDELSTLMGTFPELMAFRQFRSLVAKVLLRMQAELLEVEDDLDVIREIEREDPTKHELLSSWKKANTATSENGADQRRLNVQVAQTKLEKYYSFTLQVNQVFKLSKPSRHNVKSLKNWLSSVEGGNHFLARAGIEGTAWDEKNVEDLLAIKPQDDLLAQWLLDKILPTYHRHIGHRYHKKIDGDDFGDLWHYKYGTFVFLGNLLCILLSSLLPSGCIFALFYAHRMLIRLILTTCFTVTFSIVMTFVVQARRQDVFAAALALAAVQVVFVGSVSSIGEQAFN